MIIELTEQEIKDILKAVSLPIIQTHWNKEEGPRYKELTKFFKELIEHQEKK